MKTCKATSNVPVAAARRTATAAGFATASLFATAGLLAASGFRTAVWRTALTAERPGAKGNAQQHRCKQNRGSHGVTLLYHEGSSPVHTVTTSDSVEPSLARNVPEPVADMPSQRATAARIIRKGSLIVSAALPKALERTETILGKRFTAPATQRFPDAKESESLADIRSKSCGCKFNAPDCRPPQAVPDGRRNCTAPA